MRVENRELELDGAVEVRTPGVVAAGALLAVAVVLTALNLRPAITGVGPMLAEMRADLGTSGVWAGVLTTLPTLCFAGAGLAAPLLARRAGIGAAIAIALTALGAGLVLRVVDGPAVVLGGTLVATAGIALINVLIPVVIKDSFPARIGVMTGVYTAALQGGGALGSAVTPQLGDAFGGWRPALGGWAALAAVALLAWILAARGTGRAPRHGGAAEAGRSLLRNRLAWIVTAFFGLLLWGRAETESGPMPGFVFVAEMIAWLTATIVDFAQSHGISNLTINEAITAAEVDWAENDLAIVYDNPPFTGKYWRSLSEVGNLSSSSVLHVLRDTIAKQPPSGSPGVVMAMGPGFCSELVLLRW